jgi:hypothetical protein
MFTRAFLTLLLVWLLATVATLPVRADALSEPADGVALPMCSGSDVFRAHSSVSWHAMEGSDRHSWIRYVFCTPHKPALAQIHSARCQVAPDGTDFPFEVCCDAKTKEARQDGLYCLEGWISFLFPVVAPSVNHTVSVRLALFNEDGQPTGSFCTRY